MAITLGNPAMIAAYQAGFPGNGKPVPTGAKIAKVYWAPKPNEFFKEATVPGALVNVEFMVKDSKRFADSGGWDMPCSIMTLHPEPSSRELWLAHLRRVTAPNAGSHATRQRRRETTFSRTTAQGE